eukprot:CAMPEP_0170530272 /NCGR_PEP_ID=MMETSP0209-20121228/44097_1 /TAXON_ID=665100 ORGANISM="Litonotus pictus, Strain P1" /NCGR_SAMPLE_ID=MMETSP0209 /ASSEMBLY_ACC=CAM_ASM_000301 /LENGTH=270 /DNA_ID=CAMNT_0010823185 /DNA_START=83 /DNA_END=892 /DNA_ORIENTATION=-
MTSTSNHLQKETKLKTFMRLPNKDKHRQVKGLVYLLHGLGDCANLLGQVAHDFADDGFIVASYNYKAHYQSEGETIKDYKEVIEDTHSFINQTDRFIEKSYGKKISSNKFMWSNSMGCRIGLDVSRSSSINNPSNSHSPDWKGVMFMTPCFDIGDDFLLNIPVDEIVRSITKNPEYHEQISLLPPRVDNESAGVIMGHLKNNKAELGSYTVPFQVSVAGIDKIVSPLNQYSIYEKAQSVDKEVQFYPDMWHGFIFEKDCLDSNMINLAWV